MRAEELRKQADLCRDRAELIRIQAFENRRPGYLQTLLMLAESYEDRAAQLMQKLGPKPRQWDARPNAS
jgi:hypothetical protein